jgi:hypothetical protein
MLPVVTTSGWERSTPQGPRVLFYRKRLANHSLDSRAQGR